MIIYSQGGQFPYQAEGKIGNDYFYFRSRGNNISLELYFKPFFPSCKP